MHNASFPVRIDEIAHPRAANESFMKILVQPRRAITSSLSSEDTGLSSQCDISLLLTNIGESSVAFKVMGALRSHAAEDGASAYTEVISSKTLVAGGYLQLLIQARNKNLFSLLMTSSSASRIRVVASSESDLTVWKSSEREGEKGTHLDTFLQDEEPKLFYANSSPESGV